MGLPRFRYHPDPLATGSVIASSTQCRCCGEAKGFIYTGPVYAEEELEQVICPWCIANGKAAERFDATFVDSAGIGDGESTVSPKVEEVISCRTPGFSGWQQERWLVCCDDGAAFLGPMGRAELDNLGPQAAAAVREECGLEGAQWEAYFQSLHRENGPTAYVFQCLHCRRLLAYSDCH
jgi:uncharacterized protein